MQNLLNTKETKGKVKYNEHNHLVCIIDEIVNNLIFYSLKLFEHQ